MPFVFLAAILLSVWLSYSKSALDIPKQRWSGAALIFVVTIFLSRHFGSQTQAGTIMIGGAMGTVACIVADLAAAFGAGGPALLALVGAAGSLTALAAQKDLSNAVLAETTFSALIAVALGKRAGCVTAIGIAALSFVQILAMYAGEAFTYASLGPVLVLAISLLGILGQILLRFTKLPKAWWIPASALLSLAVVYFCLVKRMPEATGWKAMILAPVAAFIGHLSFGDDETGAFAAILLSLIWVGLATAAFGIALGFGTTLAFLIGVSVLIVWGSDKALLSAGPLMALALHRVFRELHPGIADAIDIGEHYALVGFCVGALLPLLPQEWIARARPEPEKPAGTAVEARVSAGALVWQLLLLGAPALLALFLAPKGLLGFVTGLGFCGLISLFKGRGRIEGLAVAAGIGAVAVVEYGWVQNLDELTRTDKIHWFEYCAAGLAAVALILYFLGRTGTSAAPKLETA